MADLLFVKVKYGDVLRRFSLPKRPTPKFSELLVKVQELFELPEPKVFAITYVDDEGDAVTMANDYDVSDALTIQGLNPLRLTVSRVEVDNMKQSHDEAEPEDKKDKQIDDIADDIARSLKSAFAEATKDGSPGEVKKVMKAFKPVLKAAPKKLAEVVDALLKSGFSASLEPLFTMDLSSPEEETKAEDEKKPETKEQDSGKKTGHATTVHPRNSKNLEVFHPGIQCDVCGVSPISGIRYQSTVKHDYDLCGKCFQTHGVEGEYNKLERPVIKPHQVPMWVYGNGSRFHPMGCSRGAGVSGCPRSCGKPSFEGKLDARFVADLTIFDGTELVPGTVFTKIWKLRNNGTVTWPQHTRLVHVGGDHFSRAEFVDIIVPEDGVPPDAEIDVSVDMVAPEQPGRYVSHWKLMAPGGKKFGHRVWCLIQVVPQNEPSPQVANSVELVKPEDEQLKGTAVPEGPPAEVEDVKVVVKEVEVDSPKTEKTSVGGFSFVEYPRTVESGPIVVEVKNGGEEKDNEVQEDFVDLSKLPVFVAGEDEVVVEKEKVPSGEKIEIETKLDQLQAMGFPDRVVNLEVLKANDFNVERTLEKLLAAAEWDPMLQELEEMGFNDSTTNRLLMLKNNGSIKLVVKELVQKYKESK